MSQQHPGRRRAGGRTAFLLAPALVGGLIVAFGPAAQAAPANQAPNGPADAARQTYSADKYLVQLADKPVATYSKTAPAQGKRLNARSQAVRDYVGHLKRERDKVLDEVEGVKTLHTYQYVLNGFAADLTARQASELARTPGVVSLTRNEMRRLTATATADSAAATARSASGKDSLTEAATKTAAKGVCRPVRQQPEPRPRPSPRPRHRQVPGPEEGHGAVLEDPGRGAERG